MPSIDELAAARATIYITAPTGARVKVVYNPRNVTGENVAKVEAARVTGSDRDTLEWLAETILDWDLEDADGKFAITPEGLDRLPSLFLGALLLGVLTGRSQGDKKKKEDDEADPEGSTGN